MKSNCSNISFSTPGGKRRRLNTSKYLKIVGRDKLSKPNSINSCTFNREVSPFDTEIREMSPFDLQKDFKDDRHDVAPFALPEPLLLSKNLLRSQSGSSLFSCDNVSVYNSPSSCSESVDALPRPTFMSLSTTNRTNSVVPVLHGHHTPPSLLSAAAQPTDKAPTFSWESSVRGTSRSFTGNDGVFGLADIHDAAGMDRFNQRVGGLRLTAHNHMSHSSGMDGHLGIEDEDDDLFNGFRL